jgi:hypothetical protein
MSSIAETRVGNLAVQLTSFVGRRREVSDAKRLLSASRLVTLTGPGGVGKTRLALKLAADVRRAFGDGVWLVELDQLRDPALVSDTVAESLGLREQSGRPPIAALAEFLAGRRVLLVLDNCEHLVEAVVVLAGTLLRCCPQLRILATSREIRAAYPFSPVPTRHHVTWAHGPGVYAMCAIDALGMSAMLGHPVTVISTEPGTEHEVIVQVDHVTARWNPNTAVVFAGATGDGCCPSVDRTCGHINFFTTAEAARAWAARNPGVTGNVLNRDQALAPGITSAAS